jgi:ketopantoate hydroxymethyltransferase
VKKFVNIKKYIKIGLKKFKSEVKLRKYPSQKHSY